VSKTPWPNNIAYTIVMGVATSGDSNYRAGMARRHGHESDDDAVGIDVAPVSGLATTEAGGTAPFTIVLASQPTADVVIDCQQQSGGGHGRPGQPHVHNRRLERASDRR
jgi:hypothetical protein